MSEREMLHKLIDSVPHYKIGYILAYVQGIAADEAAEDMFCESLYQEYLNSPEDEKNTSYTLEECKKEWGI